MDDNIIHPCASRWIYAGNWRQVSSFATLVTRENRLDPQGSEDRMEDAQKMDLVKKNVDLSYKMRNELLRGRLTNSENCWTVPGSTNDKSAVRSHPSTLMTFIVLQWPTEPLAANYWGLAVVDISCSSKPFDRTRLTNALTARNHTVQRFTFEPEGLKLGRRHQRLTRTFL